jgi:hypothetical protein
VDAKVQRIKAIAAEAPVPTRKREVIGFNERWIVLSVESKNTFCRALAFSFSEGKGGNDK